MGGREQRRGAHAVARKVVLAKPADLEVEALGQAALLDHLLENLGVGLGRIALLQQIEQAVLHGDILSGRVVNRS